jgi:hypothetical protein
MTAAEETELTASELFGAGMSSEGSTATNELLVGLDLLDVLALLTMLTMLAEAEDWTCQPAFVGTGLVSPATLLTKEDPAGVEEDCP